ncbi:glutathione synthase [Chryseobacterium tongliaoense]|uniref:glutathione synthase n=1 Tax=Chryseobacterium tongliaoense TaxID=3240933 RepID=UPI003514D5A7
MAQVNFKEEDFIKTEDGNYKIEYTTEEIGLGSNLIVERQEADGSYEVVTAEITREDDRVFIVWSEPFNGRFIFEK